MTTTVAIASEKSQTKIIARIGWAILIIATLYVCYFRNLGAIGFVGPDEPRYAWIARDMAETGDWVTPRLYGKPWLEKPPLYYWGAALSFKLFGVSEAAARLPSAVSALLATLALAWLALRLYGAETARWLLLLLPTTVGMIGFSHAAATDMPFSAMLTIAMVAAAVVLGLLPADVAPPLPEHAVGPGASPPHSLWLISAAFGFFLGLAALGKGPVAIILCGGAVFFWALFTKRWRDALRLLHPAAIATFCLTVLPWYILCARRNPDFLRIFILEHNFKRYLTPEFQHVQPFWFYIPVLLIALLPWTAIFLWSIVMIVRTFWRCEAFSDATIYLVAWPIFCIAFFSISQSKLPGYILPAIPPICMLMAWSWVMAAPIHRRSFRLMLLTAALFLSALLALTELATPRFSPGHESFGFTIGVIFVTFFAANLILGLTYPQPRTSHLMAGSCMVPILLLLLEGARLLPAFVPFIAAGRSLAWDLQLRHIPPDELAATPMSRSLRFGLNFYLHREIRDWDPEHPTEGYVINGIQRCRDLNVPGFTVEQIAPDLGVAGRSLCRVTRARLPAPAGGKPQ